MPDENVIDLLLNQHTEIKELMRQIRRTEGAEKRDLFDRLVRLLAVHETAEEEVVHPAARRNIESGEQVVDDRLNEEDEAKHVLSELHNLGVDHADFDSKFDSLAESVRAHADREEQKEFAQLRENVTEERLGSMAGAVRTAEAIAPTRPHPMAGESAAANVLAGPPAALFDRVRDAVRDWNKSESG